MKLTKKSLNSYGKDTDPKQGVLNEYPTPKNSLTAPYVLINVGSRGMGKTHQTSKILGQSKKDKTYDVVYCISPNYLSNIAYFGPYVNDENVFLPTKESISEVLLLIDKDRDDFEQYLEDVKEYNDFLKKMKSKSDIFSDEDIFKYNNLGWFDATPSPPVWKYDKVQPPRSLLILDDILGTPCVSSNEFTQAMIRNRHLSPLSESHSGRSALGCSVLINVQTYISNTGGGGVNRSLREQCTHLLLFKNKSAKMMDKIREELCSVIDIDKFNTAYEEATKEKYGNLLITFAPKCPTKMFIKNLQECLVFEEDKGLCNCHH